MSDRSSSDLLATIPERPAEITAAWLEAALGAPKGSLQDFEFSRIGEGSGIVGVIVRVTLAWKAAAASFPASLVVKLSPEEPDLRSRFRVPMEREVRFYRDLAADCGARTPHAFHAAFERDTNDAAIVMEDLGGATIYETGTAPTEAIVAVARHIAKIHARWWNDPRLSTMDWLNSVEAMSKATAPTARAGLPLATPWFEENAPDMLELAILRLETAERGVEEVPSLPRTLVHGDLGLKNVAFVEGEPVLFDWAAVGRNAAPMELVALVGESYGAAMGPRMLSDMVLPAYCESLREAGVTGVSYEQIREDFGIALMARLRTPLLLLATGGDAQRKRLALRWMETCRAFKDEFDFEGRLRRALG